MALPLGAQKIRASVGNNFVSSDYVKLSQNPTKFPFSSIGTALELTVFAMLKQ